MVERALSMREVDGSTPSDSKLSGFLPGNFFDFLTVRNCYLKIVWCSYGDLIILISELVNSDWNRIVLIEESKCDRISSLSSIITSTFIA